MSDFQNQYESKKIDLEHALAQVQSGQTIYNSYNALEPVDFLTALHTVAERVEEVRIQHCGVFRPYECIANPAYKGRIIPCTGFSDDYTRATHEYQVTEFTPAHLHNGLTRGRPGGEVDLFVALVSPMDKHGYFSFGLDNIIESDMIRRAKKVILEVNPNVPRVGGYTEVHISEVDFLYESSTPLLKLPELEPDETDEQIGSHVASLVEDGSTIQLGFGKIPDAVAHHFYDKNDLGVHTEMITSAVAHLSERGVITGKRKTLLPGKIVGTFALGSQKLYDFLEENPAVWMLPGRYVNDPHNIAKNYRMVSVNSALQVDLTGQICSESLGPMQFAGTGGAADFAIGATHSEGGKNIIAFRSTARGGLVSRIGALLSQGSVVTISRNDIDYIVTEYGVARMKGANIAERVEALIQIAHPDFRDELKADAKKYKLW
ncbi:4-hydroxybutyrate CoA-transferase [Clostridia bacterium]|nr:4-hydroxybutyrate CoA-transferase [Clostridia bacterium]